MTLPSSGQISFDQIRIELGVPTQAPFSLDAAENGTYVPLQQCTTPRPSSTNPAAISEWYGYNHSATASVAYTGMEGSSTPGIGVVDSFTACSLGVNYGYTVYVYSDVHYAYNTCTTGLNNFFGQPSTGTWYEFSLGTLVDSGDCSSSCVGAGGSCTDTAVCCPGLVCQSNTCAGI